MVIEKPIDINFSPDSNEVSKFQLHLSGNRIVKTYEKRKPQLETNERVGIFEVGNLDYPDDKLAVEKFRSWLINRKEWWILVERKGSSGVKYFKRDFKWFRVYNRFDKQYVKRVIRKFELAMSISENMNFVHIVLTVERKQSICTSIKLLHENWNRLRALLKKRLGKNNMFITVLEPHKDGYPHMHILLFTNKFVITQEELSNWCREHNLGYVVFIKRYWKNFRKKPIFYLIKYLGKQYKKDAWKVSDFIFYACMFYIDGKTYTFSRNFGFPRKRKSIWMMVFIGSYDELRKVICANVKIGVYVFDYFLEYFEWDLKKKVLWVVGRM